MNPEIETQIRLCEARLYTAMQASDMSELDALMADDLLFAGTTGELATKAMDLELHRTGGTQFHEFMPKELEVRVWSGQFALASAKIFLSGTFLLIFQKRKSHGNLETTLFLGLSKQKLRHLFLKVQ